MKSHRVAAAEAEPNTLAVSREASGRVRLNRERVLRRAIELADAEGLAGLSMRRLADDLGVVPMALYKHVAGKEVLLDGMVELVVDEIEPPNMDATWRAALRQRILNARRSLLRHPWAPSVIESRTTPTPALLAYIDAVIGQLLGGGFSADLTHHALHALGSRIYGFTQDVLSDSAPDDSPVQAEVARQVAMAYPHIGTMVGAADHDPSSMVGRGCDDQFEFEFALDLLLDGLEKAAQAERKARR